MQNKKVAIPIVITVAVLIWCTAIFHLSSMSSNSSNDASTDIVRKVISKVLDATNEAGITDSHPDNEKLTKAAKLTNAPLRKVVHATVYFVLALLLLAIGYVILDSRKYLLTCAITILLCFIFTAADEYHQTFADGRTGQLMDVLANTTRAWHRDATIF